MVAAIAAKKNLCHNEREMRKRMVLPFSLQLEECFFIFLKLAYLLPFSLETSRYALVAKAFHCKTAFSTTPEFDNSLVAEK